MQNSNNAKGTSAKRNAAPKPDLNEVNSATKIARLRQVKKCLHFEF